MSYPNLPRALRRLKPSRRWTQFSLRTMLVAVTVACVLLGLLAQPVREARKERAAKQAILSLDGSVQVFDVKGTGRRVIRSVLGNWVYERVWMVCLRGLPVGDEDLRHLEDFSHLQALTLGSTDVTNAGLAHLRNLTGIVELDLRHTQVTDAGLAHLKGMTGLESLDVFGTRVTYDGLERLEQELPWGNFAEERAIDEIKALGGQVVTSPEVLEDEERLSRYDAAHDLYLDGSIMSGDAMPHVRYLRSLREATLRDLRLGEEGLAPLGELPALESLEIWLTEIDEMDLMHLGQVESLRKLSFHYNEMTDTGLEHLTNLRRLETLEFHQTLVTEEGVNALREALPNCWIQVHRDH